MPEGTIEVELIKGHNLKDVEFLGKSDPFVILSVGHNFGVKDQRSHTIKDGGHHPVWNESFLIEIPDGPTQLDITVFDEEKHGGNETMGTVSIPLSELFEKGKIPSSKYPVQTRDGKFKGELELGDLKFFPKSHRGTLVVHLVEAHGLMDTDAFGKSDPYCEIHCQGKKQRSRVLQGSNPVWDEQLEVEVDGPITDVVLKLFDKDDVGGDDALGIVKIPLQKAFSTAHVPPSKYKVLGKQGQPQGEISVGLKFISKE